MQGFMMKEKSMTVILRLMAGLVLEDWFWISLIGKLFLELTSCLNIFVLF
ncbi:hypothetical protein Pint_33557 [Pistacia integerrima]|uniref:Uncharacterized protein n=1 Tax=Pistacia integerrima TaxID=434235 RepID=A0ACC0X9R3_9ROSI|nr:hypothetical protein Pint_33557 [Pistacia integerrima]KAJ0078365.1 hypothetical protein Patl1_37255 [Pistacia atlantica]